MEMVARLAGVSQVSVSRALNHPDKVAPDTLARIQEAIRVTGYVHNLVAGALASRRSGIIAALIPSITNLTYSSFLRPFIEATRRAGYQVILAETGFSPDDEQAMVQSLLSRQPEGMLLTGVHHSAECRRMLLGSGLPVVEVWDESETPIDICVGFSHWEAGRAAARYAQKKGYAHAAAITAGDPRAVRRKDAFAQELVSLGYPSPPVIRFETPASIANGRDGLKQLLERGFTKGIISCSSDLLAHGVLIEAQARGLKIPGEIAVIGFSDQDFAAHTLPALSTIRVDRLLLGRKAADALLARIAGENAETRRVDVGFEIIERESA
ncbi:LacI family DNA-binding transcriptional regulator [Phyllobacterium salinisoli]|uniref:LacI family DNA-binding transcriptional regulator n=2 Tax=Phyllobacterium salinisoli TaxID=1899321 RepID=A0A368K3R2_9HYPH|nr:LacI family DNA-binding transcriptional regulator [Phyllobacterium salinisoli]